VASAPPNWLGWAFLGTDRVCVCVAGVKTARLFFLPPPPPTTKNAASQPRRQKKSKKKKMENQFGFDFLFWLLAHNSKKYNSKTQIVHFDKAYISRSDASSSIQPREELASWWSHKKRA
jgi:hypothetical protein